MKKHIVCLGDSNTHGFCAVPSDCADGGNRYNEDERWTCLLQKALGEEYLVIEEGLSGRTTVFPDPLHEGMDAIGVLEPLLMTHEPLDLLLVMLGTNDTKEHFGNNATVITIGMERLLRRAQTTDCWGGKKPNILLIAPPPIGRDFSDPAMGKGCPEKSEQLSPLFAELANLLGVHFFDAAGCEFNDFDHMHLSRRGHAQLAERLAQVVPMLL